MMHSLHPIVGTWYRHLSKGYEFHVVAMDEASGYVEIQHFHGDLEALERKEWQKMTLETIEAPDNWTGSLDNVEPADFTYTDTDMSDAEWDECLGEWHAWDGEKPR